MLTLLEIEQKQNKIGMIFRPQWNVIPEAFPFVQETLKKGTKEVYKIIIMIR